MADVPDVKPPSDNPFDQFLESPGQKPANDAGPNPFDQFVDEGQTVGGPQGSAFGAGARSFMRSVVPAAGGLAGAGAGAEAGAALGLLGGPFAEITVPVGGAIGGILGFFGGSYAGETAQHYALKAAPDSWTDALGQSNRQQRLDEAQHPIGSFLGGLLPYALTMRPGGFEKAILPENATAMQRIIANPVTARLFGGATMGGLELSQEAVHGDVDWRKVAISTGFGLIWNKPMGLGKIIPEVAAAPTRAGLEAATRPFSLRGTSIVHGEQVPLTIEMAGDARVIGPGVTEAVFQGTQRRDQQADMIAQQQQRDAMAATGQRQQQDIGDVARRMEPDLFGEYDKLQQQRDTLDRALEQFRNPSQDQLQDLMAQRDAIQAEGGMMPDRGRAARVWRARLRAAQSELDQALERRQAYAEGRLEYTPDALRLQRQRMAIDEQMRDMANEVSASYRRARDAIAEGRAPESPAAAGAPEAAPAPSSEPPVPVDLSQGRAAIVAHAFKKWIAAGRTPDEARAAAELEADRFVTRARRFQGALGTAAELYGREGVAVRGAGGQPSPPFTPPTTAAPAAPARPVAAPAAGVERPAAGHAAAPAPPQAASAATAARPKQHPDWTIGKEVEVGPMKGMTVEEIRPDSFLLRNRAGQLWDFKPPEKAPKEENSLEWYAYLEPVKGARPDIEPAKTPIPEDVRALAREALAPRPETAAAAEAPPAPAVAPVEPIAPLRENRFPEELELAQHQARQGEAFQNGLPTSTPPRGWKPDPELADMAERLAKGKTPVSEGRRPLSLSEFVRRSGGIKRGTGEADDLIARDRGDLVRTNGRSFDDMAELARDSGFYIGPDLETGNGVNHDRFMEMLHEDAQGQKHFIEGRETEEFLDRQRFNEVYAEELERMGLKLKGMPPREIAWILSHDEGAQRSIYLANQVERLGDNASLEMVYRLDREIRQSMADEGRPEPGAWEMADHREVPAPTREELERFYDDYERASGIARAGGQAAGEQGAGASRPDEAGARPPVAGEPTAAAPETPGPGEAAGGLKTEQTEQGEQTLLPGVEPVSAREKAEAEMQKPMSGGNAAPPEGGLFDTEARKQTDLFQSAKGKIRIAPGTRSIITLMKDADPSTVIHELWHDFFEQLMRDAEHPQAPPQVRDDAQTIYDALRVNGREGVKTRHHEQVAKWGEQYLREGRAPSTGLARVFEQFKGWLTNIYQTIKGLGRPINDDVRRVFDRMLAEQPLEPVIAEDRTPAPTLADVQRRDAQETEPAQAEPVMDRIVAETQQAEQRLPPEVRDEVNIVFEAVAAKEADAAGETGAGGKPAGNLGAGGGEPGTQPAGGGGGEANGGQLGSGGNARPQGAGVPSAGAGEGAGAEPRSGAAAGPPLSPTPTAQYSGRVEWEDKAGNIRLDNLTDMESVRQMLREVSEANSDFIGDRRGVVTDQQVDDVAAAAGMQGAERLVAARIRGQAFNAGEIMTLRKALLQSADEVNAAMQAVAKPGSTDQDVLWYAMVRDRHQLIQATVAQATAEAGRALRAFRNIKEEGAGGTDEYIRQATGRTLFQMREEATLGAKLDTPEKVSAFVRAANTPKFSRMILEYWINNLISGPATHTTYMVGNMLLALQKMGPETLAAAAIGAARGRKVGERVEAGEFGAQFRGAARGFLPAVHASVEALRSGTTTLLPGETGRKAQFLNPGATGTVVSPMVNEAAKLADLKASTFGVMRGMRDAFVATDALLNAAGGEARSLPLIGTEYSNLGAIPDIRVGNAMVPVGTFQRLPSRAIAAIHSFFRVMNYSIEKSALAYRVAAGEGLTGEALAARTGALWQNPTEQIMESARHEATELTLMGQGSKFTQALSRLVNTEFLGFPWLKFIDPFVHISSNIIDQALIQRTPLGVLSPELRADLTGKNGTIAQDKAQARMLVGTAFAMTIGGLAAEGLMSGSGPTDPREAAMWRLAGNQAHSVRIGDFWYDIHRLGPVGMLASMASDLYEVAHLAGEAEFTKAAAHLQHAVTHNILDESFMRGPSDLIKAIEDPARYGESYIRNFLSTFVPFSVGLAQEARAVDPYSREARTVIDAMRQKIPFESMNLLPRVDIWGNPMPNRDAVISPGVTALYMQRISTDPVNLAMVELGMHPAQVGRKIRNVELTDQQHLQFAQLAGRMSKMRLDTIVNAPDWATWSPQTKRDVITEVIRQSREVARGQIIASDPTILQRATAAKLDRLRK